MDLVLDYALTGIWLPGTLTKVWRPVHRIRASYVLLHLHGLDCSHDQWLSCTSSNIENSTIENPARGVVLDRKIKYRFIY